MTLRFTSGFTCKRTWIVETAFATSLGPSKLVTKCWSNIGNSLLRKLVAAAVRAHVGTNTRRVRMFRRKWVG